MIHFTAYVPAQNDLFEASGEKKEANTASGR